MSSPSNARFSMPEPRVGSFDSRPAESTPRSSFDRDGYGLQGESSAASTSRRPSQSSSSFHGNHVQHSPTAMSSSSRAGYRAGEERDGWRGSGSSSPATTNNNGSGSGNGHGLAAARGMRLPRITTSKADDERSDHSHGPHSAPLRPHAEDREERLANGNALPLRSSSSPDPWTTNHHNPNHQHIHHPRPGTSSSQRSSPSHSPIEHRPNAASPVLGAPFGPSQPSIPPRLSSQPAEATVTQSVTRPTFTSNASTTTAVESTRDGEALAVASQGQAQPSSRNGSSGRGHPTFCGHCGESVHGQFVRAMSKVYHLNCFRCKVSGPYSAAHPFLPISGSGCPDLSNSSFILPPECLDRRRAPPLLSCANLRGM